MRGFNLYDRQLDSVRALAVLLVLYAHFAVPGSNLGHLGVRLFFVLSGFLITRILLQARGGPDFDLRHALKFFYARRVLRIFPAYFAMLAFVGAIDLEQARDGLAWQALFLSNFWYAVRGEWMPWVLVHSWTLSIEEQFYLVWPLIMLTAPMRFLGRICIAFIALSLAYRLCWPLTGTPTIARDLLPPASMDALAAGGLLAVCRAGTAAWPRGLKPAALILGGAFIVLSWLDPRPTGPLLQWLLWIAREVLPLAPLVVLVGLASTGFKGAVGRFMEWSPLRALGRISYGLYLYHIVVLALVIKAQPWIPMDMSDYGLGWLTVGGAATLAVACLSWLLLEKPINGFKRYFPLTPLVAPGTEVDRPPKTRAGTGHPAMEAA
ncbi:acyltransferase family protein [Mesorhizobium sp. L-8-3]|uniref:acyltransferase family protein n=1 Tax=Mesorhizobium sp. L-8-3 TaxID=2744522 RepID=UPI00192539EF